MLVDDQRAVIDFLSSPEAHGGVVPERIETHASIVFLAGGRAWKLKRAVRYDYLDYSTADRRRTMCAAEVDTNRRTAPDLYLGVKPVTRANGRLTIDGPGEAVDWLVEMRAFDEDQLLDRMAERGELDLTLARTLATTVARFHAAALPRPDHGGHAGMSWVVEGNIAGLLDAPDVVDTRSVMTYAEPVRAALNRVSAVLDRRRQHGLVRQCHGDLHLRNIVRMDGRPVLFDAIEFNDEIACTDVGYDLAFLLMDLWHRNLRRHANVVLNAYVSATGDDEVLSLLPLFLSCRAAVRAKTSAAAAALQQDAGAARSERERARVYFLLADALIRTAPAVLVAIGGLSGSGKSTVALGLAEHLGPVPGALVIRSDEVRKQMLGVPPLATLGPDGYTDAISRRVYRDMTERARVVLQARHAVILDAVFAREDDRRAAEQVAAESGVPFVGIWLDVPEDVLVARTAARRADPSDATPDVVRSQVASGVGTVAWLRLDGTKPASGLVERIRVWIEAGLPPA